LEELKLQRMRKSFFGENCVQEFGGEYKTAKGERRILASAKKLVN